MTRNQAFVSLMLLVALVRDGHTSINPLFDRGIEIHYFPVSFEQFDDGVYVKAAPRQFASLVGAKVVRIGKVPVAHALASVATTISYENEWFLKSWATSRLSLSEVTARLAARWGLPEQRITLLPMTDTPVETHVVVDDEDGGERAIHFQEWWVRHQASLPARRFVVAGLDRAAAAPGVLDAIRQADVVLLPPSNPVVSIGIVLGVPGVRDALRGTAAPVVGVSPLISGRPVRGHADACLRAVGLPVTAAGVAGLYEDFLDAWLVDPVDADTRLPRARVEAFDGPLLMTDVEATARIAEHALRLATSVTA